MTIPAGHRSLSDARRYARQGKKARRRQDAGPFRRAAHAADLVALFGKTDLDLFGAFLADLDAADDAGVFVQGL